MQTLGEAFRERISSRSQMLATVFDSVPADPLYASWHERSNIEALLFFLYAAADLHHDPAGELPAGSDGFFDGQPIDDQRARRQQNARLCAILALQACSFILDHTSHYEGSRGYLNMVTRFVPTDGPLDIFNLNYDTVIEDFCDDHGLDCIDGFNESGAWRPSLFYGWDIEQRAVRLWKLHGSVTWVKDPTTQAPKKAPLPGTWERRVLTGHSSSPTTETNLIYPGLGKVAAGPMRLLFDAFEARLRHRECRVVVAVGYSFADDDLRDLLLRALRENRNLNLVIVAGGSSRQHRQKLIIASPEIGQQVHALPERFETALEDRSIERAIRDFRADPESPEGETDFLGIAAHKPAKAAEPSTRIASPRASSRTTRERILCPGKFNCVRRLTSRQSRTLLVTENQPPNSTRLLRLDVNVSRLDVVCAWTGMGTKFVITNDRIATVTDTKAADFQFGLGTYWQVDVTTGERWPLVSERVIERAELERLALSRHRPSSDTEQAIGLDDYGIFPWPTAVEALPEGGAFLLVMSAGVLRVRGGELPDRWQRFPNSHFLNLTIAAPLDDSRFLLLETVRGAQGVLWEIDADAPTRPPRFLAGGFREPAGLVVLPGKDEVLLTENLPDAQGRLWRVDLNQQCRAELLRDDLDRPGEMVLLTEDSVAMITRDALREIWF